MLRLKKLIDKDQKPCGQAHQQLQQEVMKDLEPKCDVSGILFGFNKENKENKEKNGFLKRRPKQVKAENLHEGVFWLSEKNRDIIKTKILEIKAGHALRQSDSTKARQASIKGRALCAGGVLMSFQNDDANKREIAYISRDFEAFIPTKIKLGQGQFGTASLVQNVLTGKWYCLKILKKGVVQDSELEALMVQGMLRTNDKMPGEDTCVLINELIHGKCLTDIIREISQKEKLLVTQISAHNANMSIRETCERAQKESFSFEQALALSISSVEAYESLHGKGYVHRDIKPDNIMLDLEQKKFFAIDFGFVKKAGEKVKWSGSIKYSSPEALNRDGSIAGPDLKDDIYAMGMVAGQVVALAIYNTALYDRSELFKIFEEHSLHPHGAAHERYNYLEKTCKLTYPKQPEIQIFVNFYYEFMPIILGARNTEWQQRRKLSAQMIALCRLIYQMTEPLENRPDINTVVKKMHKIRLDHIEKRMTHFEPALDNGYNIILKELYSRRGELSNAPHVLDDLDVFLLGAVDINENNRPSVDGLTLYRAKLDDTLKLKKKLNTEIQEFYLKKLDNIQKLETKQTAEIQEHFLGKENVNLGSLNATLNSSDQENNTDVPQELPRALAQKRCRNALMPQGLLRFPVQKKLRSPTQDSRRKSLRV